MPSTHPRPTELELDILRALWSTGPASVRELTAVLNRTKPTGYTTVLKMLQIMTTKGLVERDESVRPQIYRPKYTQQQTQQQLLRELLHKAYGGSVKALVLQALGQSRPSPKTLDAIEKLLDEAERGPK